jgi:hypothetical protein
LNCAPMPRQSRLRVLYAAAQVPQDSLSSSCDFTDRSGVVRLVGLRPMASACPEQSRTAISIEHPVPHPMHALTTKPLSRFRSFTRSFFILEHVRGRACRNASTPSSDGFEGVPLCFGGLGEVNRTCRGFVCHGVSHPLTRPASLSARSLGIK